MGTKAGLAVASISTGSGNNVRYLPVSTGRRFLLGTSPCIVNGTELLQPNTDTTRRKVSNASGTTNVDSGINSAINIGGALPTSMLCNNFATNINTAPALVRSVLANSLPELSHSRVGPRVNVTGGASSAFTSHHNRQLLALMPPAPLIPGLRMPLSTLSGRSGQTISLSASDRQCRSCYNECR